MASLQSDMPGFASVAPHLSNRIHRVNGYDKKNGYMYYPVVIVGAGESGIAMAHKLKIHLKFDQFRIFDRQSGLGGTWWINRYPAVAVDVRTPHPFQLKNALTKPPLTGPSGILLLLLRTQPKLQHFLPTWPRNLRVPPRCLYSLRLLR
jgi:hypothetical protein